MAQDKKKRELMEVLAEIRKTIFTPKADAAETKPQDPVIAMPEGSAKAIENRNKAMKEAADSADGVGYKKGGMVKKTQKAKVHKGELVLTTKQVGKMKKAMKSGGC